MNLRVTPNFNTRVNTTTPQNKANPSAKFHSQPITDTVSFKANLSKFVHNSFASQLPGEEALQALLSKHSDIFGGKVGIFNRVDEGVFSHYIEDPSSITGLQRYDGQLRSMIDRYHQQAVAAHRSIVQTAKVGTVEEPVVNADGSTGFNKLLRDLLDWKKDFPLEANFAKGDGKTPARIAFYKSDLDGGRMLTESRYISKDTVGFSVINPQLAAYMKNWLIGDFGNVIEHNGVSYIVSPLEQWSDTAANRVVAGIRYTPATTIK